MHVPGMSQADRGALASTFGHPPFEARSDAVRQIVLDVGFGTDRARCLSGILIGQLENLVRRARLDKRREARQVARMEKRMGLLVTMYPWPTGEFYNVMDDALGIAMDYLDRTEQTVMFKKSKRPRRRP